jgi:type I restriction enzyme M protein
MLGAIIGDIVGSRFEWNNIKTKQFELLTNHNDFTDDSVMTLAVAVALLQSTEGYADLSAQAVKTMRQYGAMYPYRGYGGHFEIWLGTANPEPYNSYGNGAAMRVSPCGFLATSLDEAKLLSASVTKVTHNHPEGMKGAEATTVAVYLATIGQTKDEIKDYMTHNYYDLDFTLDAIRDGYTFDESCQGTVPQALEAFFESENYIDAIRNAVSIGGDSDTLAAITGGVAEAYYGIPQILKDAVFKHYLDSRFKTTATRFYQRLQALHPDTKAFTQI